MTDFPEKIWVTHKEQFSGHVGFRASDLDHSTVTEGYYPEYIRADLVPQWQPIETVPINTPVLAVVRHEPEYGRVHIVGSSSQDKLKLEYSQWMPIPKVPE